MHKCEFVVVALGYQLTGILVVCWFFVRSFLKRGIKCLLSLLIKQDDAVRREPLTASKC